MKRFHLILINGIGYVDERDKATWETHAKVLAAFIEKKTTIKTTGEHFANMAYGMDSVKSFVTNNVVPLTIAGSIFSLKETNPFDALIDPVAYIQAMLLYNKIRNMDRSELRIIVVAHSHGGLVVKEFVKILNYFDSDFDCKFILFGTPNGGGDDARVIRISHKEDVISFFTLNKEEQKQYVLGIPVEVLHGTDEEKKKAYFQSLETLHEYAKYADRLFSSGDGEERFFKHIDPTTW